MKARTLDAARLSEQGNALLAAGRTDEAVAVQQRAAAIWPESGGIQCNLGNALQAAGRTDEAAVALLRAAELEPGVPEIQNNLGALRLKQGRADEALVPLKRALALRPGYADAAFNLGNALVALDRSDEAESIFQKLAGGHAGARHNLAVLANQRGNRLVAANLVEEALAAYRQALAAEPGNADILYNEALARLVAGDLAGGWSNYDRRFDCRGKKGRRVFDFPRWDGRAPLAGKTLFLFAEQGLGDTLQFVRYVPELAARGATVHLEAQPALHALLRASRLGIASLSAKGEPVPASDYYLPLLSLPGALGTTLENIPAPAAYLRPPPESAARWRERLDSVPKRRVGLVCSGAAGHQNDRNRSIPFERIAQVLPAGRVNYFALQKDVRETDRAAMERFGLTLLGPDLGDFADTAAAAELMDLVISVDTSVAHLAAALGRPTWILLPFSPDWRWLLGREESPWYPSARLLRQTQPGNWEPVLEDVGARLRGLYST